MLQKREKNSQVWEQRGRKKTIGHHEIQEYQVACLLGETVFTRIVNKIVYFVSCIRSQLHLLNLDDIVQGGEKCRYTCDEKIIWSVMSSPANRILFLSHPY
jgi:hypothetical protein